MASQDMLPGTLDFLILSTLASGDLHGYAIARSIESRSQDVLQVGQGSLYPALYRLERAGNIKARQGTSETGRRVKIFSLTAAGRRALTKEAEGWASFTTAVSRVVKGSTS